jgi:quinol-cytochrome oxidoreductase complex cytochrome b subunit/coenzyme F420-reducing hydrogenase delta subunit/ferredoxin
VIRHLEQASLKVFQLIESVFNQIFGERWNPWYQLGALSFYFFWVIVVSGLYLFIFFDTSINGAYESMHAITYSQWYAGGVMRSLHRYASDGMAVTVTLHLLREFSLGRFRAARWFSWFSGVPLLWLLFAAAIGGYWLVWDQYAQYIAEATSEWFGWMPFIGTSLARNFVSNQTLSDRFFSLLVFMHIALPLFLLMGMLIHIKHIKLAKTSPPKGLARGTLAALIVLSLIKPAVSMEKANMSMLPANIDLDWIYMNVYPLLDSWGPGPVWALLIGISGLLAVLPWISPEKKSALRVAEVDPDNCNGCSWCYQDCPYEAITMVEHDYKKGHKQAKVNPDLCTACGICAGSCPSATPFRHVEELISGIEVPDFSIEHLREQTDEKLKQLTGNQRLVVFGCDHALDINTIADDQTAVISLPCTGLLPPSFADYISRQEQIDGVLVSGCCTEDCYFRKGSEWTEQRFHRERMPHLRTKAGKQKVKLAWAGPAEQNKLLQVLSEYRAELALHHAEKTEGGGYD